MSSVRRIADPETPFIEIPLFKNKGIAVIDAADADIVLPHDWYLMNMKRARTQYAQGYLPYPDGGKKLILLHRFLLQPPPDMEVDHVNGNGLDNRRHNLRLVTRQQNCLNISPSRNGTSMYRGVQLSRRHDRWIANIHRDGKRYRVGTFATESDAAHAYDVAACALYGEYARLNFPDERPSLSAVQSWNHHKVERVYSSVFRGVGWKKSLGKWHASIRNNGRLIHIGYFDDEIEAARAYDREARSLRGDDATLNFSD